jgi:hypothetical protein
MQSQHTHTITSLHMQNVCWLPREVSPAPGPICAKRGREQMFILYRQQQNLTARHTTYSEAHHLYRYNSLHYPGRIKYDQVQVLGYMLQVSCGMHTTTGSATLQHAEVNSLHKQQLTHTTFNNSRQASQVVPSWGGHTRARDCSEQR